MADNDRLRRSGGGDVFMWQGRSPPPAEPWRYPLKPMMLYSDFVRLLDAATSDAIAFAKTMLLDNLPSEYVYRIFPNQSYDDYLEPDEIVYPSDSLPSNHDYLESDRDGCIRWLYRDGRIPEWIDISVGAADTHLTYIYCRCCGRFTDNDTRLYYNGCNRGPFGIKSPAIPPSVPIEETNPKFWLADIIPPPRSG